MANSAINALDGMKEKMNIKESTPPTPSQKQNEKTQPKEASNINSKTKTSTNNKTKKEAADKTKTTTKKKSSTNEGTQKKATNKKATTSTKKRTSTTNKATPKRSKTTKRGRPAKDDKDKVRQIALTLNPDAFETISGVGEHYRVVLNRYIEKHCDEIAKEIKKMHDILY